METKNQQQISEYKWKHADGRVVNMIDMSEAELNNALSHCYNMIYMPVKKVNKNIHEGRRYIVNKLKKLRQSCAAIYLIRKYISDAWNVSLISMNLNNIPEEELQQFELNKSILESVLKFDKDNCFKLPARRFNARFFCNLPMNFSKDELDFLKSTYKDISVTKAAIYEICGGKKYKNIPSKLNIVENGFTLSEIICLKLAVNDCPLTMNLSTLEVYVKYLIPLKQKYENEKLLFWENLLAKLNEVKEWKLKMSNNG